MAVEALHREQEPDVLSCPDLPVGIPGWMAWLHPMVPQADWMAVVERPGPADKVPAMHTFPAGITTPAAAMLVARKALASGRVTSVRLKRRDEDSPVLLAVPLRRRQIVHRVLLLRCRMTQAGEQQALASFCQWASVCIRLPDEDSQSLDEAAMSALFRHRTAASVAIAIASSLKHTSGSDRVSVAVRRRGSTRLELLAMSDQVRIDGRRVLPVQIIAAMQEGIVDESVRLVGRELSDVQRARYPACSSLFNDQGRRSSILCVHSDAPPTGEAVAGTQRDAILVVLLLERQADRSFTDRERRDMQALTGPACLLLANRLQEQAGWQQRLRERAVVWLDGPYLQGLARRHWTAGIAAMLATLVLFLPVPQRISARAVIESRDLQVVAAPLAGIIATSHVRPGDSVKEGQLLATLDDTDLTLAADKWHSESIKNDRSRDLALASRDRVELGRLKADAARIDAERSLVEHQLLRTRLRAPFDGVVLSGDLSHQLGASVTQGDTLFTIGSSDAYRLILDVDERDAGLVETGQHAYVRMAALPDRTWTSTLDAVLPVASASEQGTVFRVPAMLDDHASLLRPGMEGVARVHVGTESLVWVYTRRLRQNVKLWLWHLGMLN